jgi:amidase
MHLLYSMFAASAPIDQYLCNETAAKAVSPDDNSLAAWRARGRVTSFRDWKTSDAARVRLRQQWRALFREWDVALCPPMPTPAFPHDHNPVQSKRHIDIDGTLYPYLDQMVWPGLATVAGLPATAAPIDHSEIGLPIGVQIIGPYLEDRTTIRFAKLVEREFGGFVAPPGF